MLCEPATYLTWRTFALHKASIAATLWEVRFVQIINIPLLILNSDFCLWCYRADPALWGLNLLQVIQPCKADCASHHWPGCCRLLGLQRWRSVLLILKNQYAVNIINTNTGPTLRDSCRSAWGWLVPKEAWMYWSWCRPLPLSHCCQWSQPAPHFHSLWRVRWCSTRLTAQTMIYGLCLFPHLC